MARPVSRKPRAVPRARTKGAYIIRAIEGRPQRVQPGPPGSYVPSVPTDEDRRLARALLAVKRRLA